MSVVLVIGDTKPDIVLRPRNLPAGVTVVIAQFRLQLAPGVVLDKVLSKTGERWYGSFSAGEITAPGRYLGELVCTLSNGGIQHGRDPIEVIVRPQFFRAEDV